MVVRAAAPSLSNFGTNGRILERIIIIDLIVLILRAERDLVSTQSIESELGCSRQWDLPIPKLYDL
jgi:hypothetical protein